MIVRDIQRILESWAPKEIAWERDNVGLLVGSSNDRVRKILVCLDVTDEVVAEARATGVDLIVSHHPLLFHPLRALSEETRIGRITTALVKQGIAVYAAHTNLDFAESGVSVALAEQLKLKHIEVLQKNRAVYKKLVVFVPLAYVEEVTTAMAKEGAGVIGRYEQCSFRTEGTGTFIASAGSTPYVGKVGQRETVTEIRLEMIVPEWNMTSVLAALRASHPYEEVAYDIYDLSNASRTHGAGAIGELATETTLALFLKRMRSSLNIKAVRYAGDLRGHIKRVAVCGGSGSDLLQTAVQQNADVFITADISYHTFQAADNRIALVDAGHFETEQPVIRKIVDYLKAESSSAKEKIQITASARACNPVQYYLS